MLRAYLFLALLDPKTPPKQMYMKTDVSKTDVYENRCFGDPGSRGGGAGEGVRVEKLYTSEPFRALQNRVFI